MRYALAALLFLLTPAFATSDSAPIRLYVQSDDSDDIAGRQLIYAFREAVRASSAFVLVSDEDQAGLKLIIATMDPIQKNSMTVHSVVILLRSSSDHKWLYFDSSLGVCGIDVVARCANQILDSVDREMEPFRRKARAKN